VTHYRALYENRIAPSPRPVTAPPYTVHRFRRTDIDALAPDEHGCYALYSGDICVYIGSGPLRARLLAHLERDIYCITLHHPTRWFLYQCEDPDAASIALIRELRPRCNPRVD
jgi:hypothetical protein